VKSRARVATPANDIGPGAGRFAGGFSSNVPAVKTAVLGALVALWLAAYGCRLLTSGFPPGPIRSTGMIATGLIDGLHLPLRAYRIPVFTTNGHLTHGLFLTPIYWLFGSRYLWIVLLSSSFVVLGLAGWAWAVRRAWGFSCAAMFLFLCACPPPYFEVRSHSEFWGTHVESMFFSGAALFLFLPQRARSPGFWQYAALAALAAWGGFFNIQNIPLIATIVVVTAWRYRRIGLRRLAWPAAPVFGCFCGLLHFSFGNYLRLPESQSPSLSAMSAPAIARAAVDKLQALFSEALPFFVSVGPGVNRWHRIFDVGGALGGVGPAVSLAFYAVTLLGLTFLVVAALTPASGPPTTRRVWGRWPVDPPGLEDGRRDETVWLTRFAVVLFAAWLGAYAASRYRIVISDDGCRYLMTLFPIVLAACCYALAFLPGAVKWLALLPFLAAGFAGLCGAASAAPASPAETWQELNAQRGDDYAYFLSDDRSHRLWEAPNGPDFGSLPSRWRNHAWTVYGARMPDEQVQRWRSNPDDPAAPAAQRALIAMGRGQTIGPRYCDCESAFSADDFPSGEMETPTAAAFFAGIAFGCFHADYHAQSLPRAADAFNEQFAFGPEMDAKEAFGPERTCRPSETGETLRRAQQRSGLTPAQAWEAFLAGASMYLGATNHALAAASRENICRSWAPVFAVDAAAGCPASFRENLAEGYALAAMNHCRIVRVRPDPENSQLGFRGSLADWPLVCAALRRWGVDAIPLDETGRRYALRFVK
jgi:hypothetical protein